MTKFQKIFTIAKSVIMILIALLIMFYPSTGYKMLLMILEIALFIYGIRLLIYYFSLARFKVGGLWTFYKSLMIIDLSIFLFGIQWAPRKLVMIIMIILLAFDGVVYIMKAMKSKSLKSGKWKPQILLGAFLFVIAIVCIISINSVELAAVMFSIALIISEASEIISAAKSNEIIYIG